MGGSAPGKFAMLEFWNNAHERNTCPIVSVSIVLINIFRLRCSGAVTVEDSKRPFIIITY